MAVERRSSHLVEKKCIARTSFLQELMFPLVIFVKMTRGNIVYT